MQIPQERRKQETVIGLENQTNITRQTHDTSPRALNVGKGFQLSFEGICHMKDIFERITTDCNFDFQTFLTFRLISKSICGCEVMRFFLQNNVKISFMLSELVESFYKFVQDKLLFAEREKVVTYTGCSFFEFSHYFNYLNKNLYYILRIDNINEIKHLNQALLENKDITLDHIKGLDLKKIGIDSNNIEFISKFLLNIAEYGNSALLGLSLGYIDTHLMPQDKYHLKLPTKFCNLESLSIQSLHHSTLIFFPEFPKLKNFTVGSISYGADIHFPHCLNNLTTCIIGGLYTGLELPELPNLKKLCIGSLLTHPDQKNMDSSEYEGWIDLPESLPNLTYLSINKIEEDLIFHLEAKLNNLKTLVFGPIGLNVEIKLQPPLDNLTDLSMDNLLHDTVFELPPSLANLKTFSIQRIQSRAKIHFPPLNNFETLIIGDIDDAVDIRFQGLLPKFKTLNIKSIQKSTTFQLSDELVNIKEFKITSLGYNSVLILPKSLPELVNLTINQISSGAKYDLSSTSFPNLQNLNLDSVSVKPALVVPSPLFSFYIDEISKNTDFIVSSDSIKNLTEFTIRNIEESAKVTFNGAFNNLEILNLGNIKPKSQLHFSNCSFNNLKTLTLGYIESGDFWLPDSLNKVKTIIIREISRECVSFSFPSTLDNLTTLEIKSLYVGCKTQFELPKFLPNLKNLIIDNYKATLQLPSLTNATKSFSINGLYIEARDKLLDLINSALIPDCPLQETDHLSPLDSTFEQTHFS